MWTWRKTKDEWRGVQRVQDHRNGHTTASTVARTTNEKSSAAFWLAVVFSNLKFEKWCRPQMTTRRAVCFADVAAVCPNVYLECCSACVSGSILDWRHISNSLIAIWYFLWQCLRARHFKISPLLDVFSMFCHQTVWWTLVVLASEWDQICFISLLILIFFSFRCMYDHIYNLLKPVCATSVRWFSKQHRFERFVYTRFCLERIAFLLSSSVSVIILFLLAESFTHSRVCYHAIYGLIRSWKCCFGVDSWLFVWYIIYFTNLFCFAILRHLHFTLKPHWPVRIHFGSFSCATSISLSSKQDRFRAYYCWTNFSRRRILILAVYFCFPIPIDSGSLLTLFHLQYLQIILVLNWWTDWCLEILFCACLQNVFIGTTPISMWFVPGFSL